MIGANSGAGNVRWAIVVEHASSLPEGEGWEYELSWPGERVIATKEGDRARIHSVTHARDLTNRFPALAASLVKLRAAELVLEGMIRTVEPWQSAGFIDFAPPSIHRQAAGRLRLIAADLLWLDGIDLRPLVLPDRKQRLRTLLRETDLLEAAPLAVPLDEMMAQARRLGADAVIAKKRNSRYRPFGRIGDWVRVSVGTAVQSVHVTSTPFTEPHCPTDQQLQPESGLATQGAV
jgi:bifunctional non-homologous end joining protein LigD